MPARVREELEEGGEVEIDEEQAEPSPREVNEVDDRAEAAEQELQREEPVAKRKHGSNDALACDLERAESCKRAVQEG